MNPMLIGFRERERRENGGCSCSPYSWNPIIAKGQCPIHGDANHASDCPYWCGEKCDCITAKDAK